MYYKIIEKKSLLDAENDIKQSECIKKAEDNQSELIDNFMTINDSLVKSIHINQEQIKNDLGVVFKHSETISKISKESIKQYNEFIEYMKEAGDLYNYSNILSSELDELHDKLITYYSDKSVNTQNKNNE